MTFAYSIRIVTLELHLSFVAICLHVIKNSDPIDYPSWLLEKFAQFEVIQPLQSFQPYHKLLLFETLP